MFANLQRLMSAYCLQRLFSLLVGVSVFVAPALAAERETWSKLMSKSEIARDLGDLTKSQGFLEKALKDAPPGIPAAINNAQLAEILILKGQHGKAREAAKRGLAFSDEISPLPQLRGQLLEASAHALYKTGGDADEISRQESWARKIRQDRNSPLIPRYLDYGLRHAHTGFVFPTHLGKFKRVNAKQAGKNTHHVQAKYAAWLGKSAVFANIVIYTKGDEPLRHLFDQVRAMTRHHLKNAKRLTKGDYKVAKTAGMKGLEVQWLIAKPSNKNHLWHGLYFMERKNTIIQLRGRALAKEAKRAANFIDDLVRSFEWGQTANN